MLRPISILLALSLAVPALAQNTAPAKQPEASSVTTLHAATRLVLIDVVVTDSHHNPVRGLKAGDFTLLEDKVIQPLKAFDEHASVADASKIEPRPVMPPGVFTNFSPAPANGPINIVLIDRLNTPMQNQSFLRMQLLDFIKGLKPGTRIAIFGLDQVQLRMLQGFTDDPELLKSVVSGKKNNPKASPLLDDPNGSSGSESAAAQMAEMINPNLDEGMDAEAAQLVALLNDMQKDVIEPQLQQDRALLTLNAMHSLALYLSGIPGRKNLIWFSGSFPIDILPDPDSDSQNGHVLTGFGSVDDTEDLFHRVTDMLARSQVAVYPVDARGLQVLPSTTVAQGNPQYVNAPGNTAQDRLATSSLSQDNMNFALQTIDEHTTMREMAYQTGGQPFVNTNDLSGAVSEAIRDGSSYYTLAYSPSNNKWNDDYRKIEVRLQQQGYSLSYRRGYYADDPARATNIDTTSANHSAALQVALVHGAPQATQIVFSSSVHPTASIEDTIVPGNEGGPLLKPPYRRYTIGFGVDPHALTFDKTADGIHHANIEFVTFAYNADGKVINAAGSPIKIDYTDPLLLKALKSGIPFSQEISVPAKGDYTLRIAVHDLHNDRVGSIEVPLAAVARLAPAK